MKRAKVFTLFALCILCLSVITGCEQAPSKSYTIDKSDTAQSSTSSSQTSPLPVVGNDTDVEMSAVDSTCFSEIGYDPDEELLLVRFKDSGSLYSYADVPQDVYDEFESADSLGGYYNDYIKGQYDCERLE